MKKCTSFLSSQTVLLQKTMPRKNRSSTSKNEPFKEYAPGVGWGEGAVAEWNEALLLREKINKTQRSQVRPPPRPGQSLKKKMLLDSTKDNRVLKRP